MDAVALVILAGAFALWLFVQAWINWVLPEEQQQTADDVTVGRQRVEKLKDSDLC